MSAATTHAPLSTLEQDHEASWQPVSPHDDYEDVSDAWLQWCADAGRCCAPALVRLHDRVKQIDAAMLSTLDGFNICAIGIEDAGVGRAAAVASSLHAVAAAAAGQGRARGSFDHLSLVCGNRTTVFTTVEHAGLGQLLLWARADDVALGVLLMSVRDTGAQIHEDLAHLGAQMPSI